jgi:hypothetical protein
MLRSAVRAALVCAVLLGVYGSVPVLSDADDLVTVLITLREQPAVQAALSETRLVRAGLAADEQDQDDASRTARLMRRMSVVLPAAQAPLVARLRDLKGEVIHAGRAFNAVSATVPRASLAELRARHDVVAVEIDEPRHALLDITAQAMLVEPFWTSGRTGGAVDVAVIDTGLYVEHEAYAARAGSVLSSVFHDAARTRPEYYDFPDDPDDYGGHGTFVSGLVFSQGGAFAPARKGIAHGIDKLFNLKAGYAVYPSGGSSLLSDVMAAVDWALIQPDPPEVFNYSYGARYLTDDDSYTRFWDGVVDAFGRTVTVSAGNSGPGAGTVGSPGMAHNILSVANVNHRGTAGRADDIIATTSSRGPTPGGRKKPDIAAPGSSIWMPSHYGRAAWLQGTGTSFSSPAIAGAAALLIDAGVTDPRSVKAVLLNSADDLGGAGWDPAFGWGYYNGERAWEERQFVSLETYGPPATPGGRRFFERSSAAPTKATAAWHRHVAYSVGGGTPLTGVLNDFDLHLFERNGNALRASSTSTADNVEQVTTGISEPAVLVVQSAGSFNGSTDLVALAHNGGFVERDGPGIAVSLAAPGAVAPGTTFTVTASVGNDGDLRGHGYRVTLTLPAGFILAAGNPTQTITAIDPALVELVSWSVRAPDTDRAAQPFLVAGTTTSYGWQWSATASVPVASGAGCSYGANTPSDAPSAGGVVVVRVTAPPGCAWSAASGASWIDVDPGAGAGSAEVSLSVAPNPGTTDRTAVVSVAGIAVPVAQAASPRPAPRRYYLAEGATGPLFDMDIAILNPNAVAVAATATFLRDNGSQIVRVLDLPASSRLTLHVNAVPGLESGAVSTVIESPDGLPLVVERTMSWDQSGYGGHGGGAVDGPATRWYFAEGSQGFFDTYLLLANPGGSPARVSVTFLREGAGPLVHPFDVAANSRFTVYAGDVPGLAGHAFSIVVDADVPIIAERAMYWSADGQFWTGGHESAGATGPTRRWFHAEGATGAYFDTYLLLANPNQTVARVAVTYLLPDGTSVTRTHDAPPQSRTTIDVERESALLADTPVSIAVDADQPVVSERAMYWPGTSATWREAHNSFGLTEVATRWGLAEGCQGGPRRHGTYVLIANPSPADADVRVEFLREAGPPLVKSYRVAATSRFNVDVGAMVPELADQCFGTVVSTNGAGISVERAMYWNAGGVTWAAGTNATAARLP